MHLHHSQRIWREFPELVPGVLVVEGIASNASVDGRLEPFYRTSAERLATSTEGEFPEIQAWRRAFAKMGLKPTQYRCASESLLRRFRKEGDLPRIHPLIDLCNAVSLTFAIPVAAIDVAWVDGGIEVRHAGGDERYETFGGEFEHPQPGEVVFADAAGNAHARRWTNRQSGRSAVRESTGRALIVAEALHATARADVDRLITTLAGELEAVWSTTPRTAILSAASPRIAF